jgi:hypothetical protein
MLYWLTSMLIYFRKKLHLNVMKKQKKFHSNYY